MTSIDAQPAPVNDNPYLSGNYAPVDREITAFDLSVTGTVPDHLDGRFLRIGPNPIGPTDPARYEWFSGAGMVHGLRIGDGRAQWYRNRWVRSADVARRLNKPWPGGPSRGGFDFAANTNVLRHAGRLLALVEEGGRPYELSEELETLGASDFCGTLRGGYSGHPKRDPITGELHAIAYNPLWGNKVRYTVTGTDGRVRRTVDIPLQRNIMVHDFSLTENYVIIYDLPVTLDLAALSGSRGAQRIGSMLTPLLTRRAVPTALTAAMAHSSNTRQPDIGLPYRWNPDHDARLVVLPREGTAADARSFSIPPCFVYHTLNAHDDGEKIVLELARLPKAFDRSTAPISGGSTLERWTVDLSRGSVDQLVIDDRPQEFPRLDERLVGRTHRYGYTVGFARDGAPAPVPEVLMKHDRVRSTAETVDFGAGREPSEFVFVPSAADAAEDDGVLMGFVYDHATDRSDLIMLDAQTLQHRAAVHLPARVPNGFHGNWLPAER